MEYPQIISLVPEGEHFDASAVNEGVWVSAAHLVNVETRITALVSEAALADQRISTEREAAEAAQNSLTAANTSLSTSAARISELEAEVVGLKRSAAKEPETTTAEADALGANATNKFETSYDREMRERKAKYGK
jgi:hypothetical protein